MLLGCLGLLFVGSFVGMVVGGCFGVVIGAAVNLLVLLGYWLRFRFCFWCFGLLLGGLV